MKLGDLSLLEAGSEKEALRELLDEVNATARDYPRDSTVHAEFSRVAQADPASPAIINGDASRSYGDLESFSNRTARLLLSRGVEREELAGVLLEDSFLAAAALLGVLKAGAAYLPLEGDTPVARLKGILDETGAKVLISEKRFLRVMNQLQWECPALSTIVCADSNDFSAECEPLGTFSDERIWDVVGDQATDDIMGGGWKDSFAGQWMSRQVMDEYAMNVRTKLAPLLDPSKRVLEIGCSSGITLLQVAPQAARYFGTDLSERILEKTRAAVGKAGLKNVELAHLAAHETELVPEGDFDLVILNSVVQCFSGHNYLRKTLRQAIAKIRDRGVIFLGDLSDLDLRSRFIEALKAFERDHAGQAYQTHTDRSAELYLSRAFLNDLRHEMPEIARIEFSRSLGQTRCEMVEYGFDALLYIDKTLRDRPESRRAKFQLDARAIDAEAAGPLPERACAEQLAYVIYTSGTTGRPKGSAIEHRAILRLAKNSDFVPLNRETRLLRTGALSFDASTLEFWGPLLNGGAICHAPAKTALDPSALRSATEAGRVNTMWFTAALFNRLADDDVHVFAGLRYVLAGGEKLSPPHIAKVKARHPEITLINGYGPTENAVFTTTYRIDEAGTRDIPIGKPITNSRVFIYAGAELAPVNVPGELCAAGDGLARCYWKNARLTAERFTPDPEAHGGRLYRTGDVASWRADGNIEFIGRADDQVKLRGFRIETGEIEKCMARFPGILQAVVAATGSGPYGKELAAWFTSAVPVDPDSLRRHMAAELPDYMIPADFMAMERLPLMKNGKVDRRALPDPRRATGRAGRAPDGETERRLLAIWERVLERSIPGTDSNFFECGGHSLKVPALVAAIREEFGTSIPYAAVFRTPTVRGLAEVLIAGAHFDEETGAEETTVLLNDAAAPLRLFAFPPGRSDAMGYGGLARALTGTAALWSFNFLSSGTRLTEYVEAILEEQPEGPYLLFGYSAGGRLAYHVAAELERRGSPVAAVLMADSSRYLQRIPIPPGEVERMVLDFVESEAIKPFVTTAPLRDKAIRRIHAYYDYIYNTVDSWVVDADIHLIVCEQALTSFQDAEGQVLASNEAWKDATRGRLLRYQGSGTHNEMFNEPALSENAALIRKALYSLDSLKRKGEHAG